MDPFRRKVLAQQFANWQKPETKLSTHSFLCLSPQRLILYSMLYSSHSIFFRISGYKLLKVFKKSLNLKPLRSITIDILSLTLIMRDQS